MTDLNLHPQKWNWEAHAERGYVIGSFLPAEMDLSDIFQDLDSLIMMLGRGLRAAEALAGGGEPCPTGRPGPTGAL